MTSFCIQPGGRLQGKAAVPGGKSTSHRAVRLTDRRRNMTRFRVNPGGRLQGEATVPGGKSTSQRAAAPAAIADGI